jgi:hypothetical protein
MESHQSHGLDPSAEKTVLKHDTTTHDGTAAEDQEKKKKFLHEAAPENEGKDNNIIEIDPERRSVIPSPPPEEETAAGFPVAADPGQEYGAVLPPEEVPQDHPPPGPGEEPSLQEQFPAGRQKRKMHAALSRYSPDPPLRSGLGLL